MYVSNGGYHDGTFAHVQEPTKKPLPKKTCVGHKNKDPVLVWIVTIENGSKNSVVSTRKQIKHKKKRRTLPKTLFPFLAFSIWGLMPLPWAKTPSK